MRKAKLKRQYAYLTIELRRLVYEDNHRNVSPDNNSNAMSECADARTRSKDAAVLALVPMERTAK
jgi:hypothetical protein